MEGGEGRAELPIPAYLIEHPKGRALFDTGMHPDCQGDPTMRVGPRITGLFSFRYRPGEEISARLGIGLVYKTSFDKANRTSARSARGIGLDAALPIFADIRQSLGVAVLTDVHESEQCARVAEVVGPADVECARQIRRLRARTLENVSLKRKGNFKRHPHLGETLHAKVPSTKTRPVGANRSGSPPFRRQQIR